MKAWLETLDSLESILGKEAVDQWLRPIKVVRFDAANLFLDAAPFQKAWFEEHAWPYVKGAFVNNNARPIKIHWESAQTIQARPGEERLLFTGDPLEEEFTLESFLPQGNEMAVRMAKELLASKQALYNPVFLFGPKGSGKTHLLTAIAKECLARGLKAMYVRAGTFTDQVVSSIRSGSMQPLRAVYRSLDVLLVDDLHVFARKHATQEEFFHTFNALHTLGKQILLGASAAPAELQEIEPRLISRFEWGISIRLHPPSPEMMPALLQANMKRFDLEGEELLSWFLSRFNSHPLAPIEAVHAYAMRVPKHTPLSDAALYLKDLLAKEEGRALSHESILREAAAHFGIRVEDLTGKSRMREFAQARHVAVYLCRTRLQMPLQAIGRLFQRDHSTILASIEVIEEKIQAKDPLASALSAISKKLSK